MRLGRASRRRRLPQWGSRRGLPWLLLLLLLLLLQGRLHLRGQTLWRWCPLRRQGPATGRRAQRTCSALLLLLLLLLPLPRGEL